MELIDKAVVVAEIKKLKSKIDELSSYGHGWHDALRMLEAQIDTLEVKEVNLDKSLTDFMSRYAYENGDEYPSSIDIAKHFFEFGIAVSNKVQKGE